MVETTAVVHTKQLYFYLPGGNVTRPSVYSGLPTRSTYLSFLFVCILNIAASLYKYHVRSTDKFYNYAI